MAAVRERVMNKMRPRMVERNLWSFGRMAVSGIISPSLIFNTIFCLSYYLYLITIPDYLKRKTCLNRKDKKIMHFYQKKDIKIKAAL